MQVAFFYLPEAKVFSFVVFHVDSFYGVHITDSWGKHFNVEQRDPLRMQKGIDITEVNVGYSQSQGDT